MFARSLTLLLFALTTLHAFQTPTSHCEGLEAKLKDDPNNAQVREDLVTCYFALEAQMVVAGGNIQPLEKKRADQVLWLIQNKPEDAFVGSPTAVLQPTFADEEASSTVKIAWQEQIKTHPDNASILFNASNSLMLSDFDMAVELAEKAHQLDAGNKEISLRLGLLYRIKLQHAAPEQRAQIAQKALQLDEEALGSASGENRFVQLSEIAKAALEANDEVKAQKYAEELLELASQYKTNWNYGNAIHHGNLLIGRIALRHGDLVEAKARLLKAGDTPGSPQLNSFGPNMMLAKELLEKHEKDVVLDYFMKCEKFWELRGQKLAEWKTLVRQDRIPDFGGNLAY